MTKKWPKTFPPEDIDESTIGMQVVYALKYWQHIRCHIAGCTIIDFSVGGCIPGDLSHNSTDRIRHYEQAVIKCVKSGMLKSVREARRKRHAGVQARGERARWSFIEGVTREEIRVKGYEVVKGNDTVEVEAYDEYACEF